MWIFMSHSFVSVVEHPKHKDLLMIRARRKEDLAPLNRDIEHTPQRDYPFRCYASRAWFSNYMLEQIESINYSSFKTTIDSPKRLQAYTHVWACMIDDLQEVESLYKWKDTVA